MIKIETVGKPYMRYLAKVIPLAFDESMSYYEQVCSLRDYLIKEVMPTINNNAEALEELRNYVVNYFDNLDIQEEVDNKLEEMYENGQLATLVSQFLQLQALFVYENVASMQLGTNFTNGSIVKTLHFRNNDNGGAYYKIRTITNEDVIDNITLFAITNLETLVAELIPEYNMNTDQFGFTTNEDNTTRFDKIVDYINDDIIKELNINEGTYILSDKLVIENVNNITISGKGTISNEIHDNNCLQLENCENVIIKDITLTSTYQYSNIASSEKRGIIRFHDLSNFEIYNIKMEHINTGLIFTDCDNGKIHHNYANDCKTWPYMFGEYGESHEFYDNDNIDIHDNISNNCSDGIKLTGYISNILIHDNISKNNTRDGIDYAGFSCKEISIYNNLLVNNTGNGIEYKHLDRTTYTPDPTKDLFFKNISIYNNKCLNNKEMGINLAGYYNDDNENYDIIVKNNEVIYDLTETNSNVYGITVTSNTYTSKDNAVIIDNNIIKGYYRFGLQLKNSNNVLITNNLIEKTQRGGLRINYDNSLYSSYSMGMDNVVIKGNKITNGDSGGSIVGANTSSITNCTIINNTFTFTRSSNYPYSTLESNINTLINYCSITESSTPSGRSYKNMIYYSSDPATTACVGWIATTTGTNVTFKKYIDLS